MWTLGLAKPPSNPDTGEPYDETELGTVRDHLRFITDSSRVADATSVYRTDASGGQHRSVTTLGPSKPSGQFRDVPEPPSLAPIEGAPAEPGGTYGVALAMRLGFTHRPTVPYESVDPLPSNGWGVDLVLRGQPTPRSPGARFDNSPISDDAWKRTEGGLGWIYRRVSRPEHLFVLGSSLSDLSLAICWDRMQGHSSGTWVPSSFYENDDAAGSLGNALAATAWDLEREGGRVVVTSCSLPIETVRSIVDSAQAKAVRGIGLDDDTDPGVAVVTPDALELRATHYLGFVPEDFDIVETLPVAEGPSGELRMMAPVPVHVPRERVEAGARRPDWEVDVALGHLSAPTGRGLSAQALASSETDWTTVRASRVGVSFDAHDMGWVDAGANLRQSIAAPHLRYPGLREWIGWMVGDDLTVTPSDAGRSAQVCARLWGGRTELLTSFNETRPLLLEFIRRVSSDSTGFPDHDGLSLVDQGVVLTIAGSARALGRNPGTVRDPVDRLVVQNVLRRGVVLRCGECFERSFVAVDTVAQRNGCPRCGAFSELVAGSWGDPAEPVWYYSLHPAVRKLMQQNGDVPILGAAYLRDKARHYVDESELEWRSPSKLKPLYEIDLVAVMDDEVVVAEAKRNPARHEKKGALDKLVEVAAQLRADTIALLSGPRASWSEGQVDHLRSQIRYRRWIDGRRPRLVEVCGLTDPNGVVMRDLVQAAPAATS